MNTSVPALSLLSAPSLLRLIWLASPALPVGSFSYSEGLESAVEVGLVSNEEQAGAWLLDQLHLSPGRSDLPILAQALPAWREGDLDLVRRLNDWILQTRETSEQRQQSLQMGRSLVEWLRHDSAAPRLPLDACAALPPSYPIAFALAAASSETTPRDVLLAFTFGWAEAMMQAAIKAVPLGQSAGQRILARLSEAVPPVVERALATGEDERQAFSPMLAIVSSQHEAQYSRLFRS